VALEEAGVEEVLVVALHAEDGRVDEVEVGSALLDDALANAVDGGLTGVGVADDATLSDVGATGFELGFDEDDGGAAPWLARIAECAEDSGEYERRGDEGYVHRDEGRGGCAWDEEFPGGEEAGVGAFAEGDARIVAEFLGDLAIAGVDGQDSGGTALEHAVGEAASGGSDVDAGEVGEVDGPVRESALELEAAAANVFEIGAEKANYSVGGDGGAWLVNTLFVDEDTSGEDESLRAFARSGVALVDEKLVNTLLWGLAARRVYGVAHRLDSFHCVLIDK
jgi:hypothetical protein